MPRIGSSRMVIVYVDKKQESILTHKPKNQT
jgi:hypothetical protein